MASKALVVEEHALHQESHMLTEATVTLAGRDLCSISDLSRSEIGAIMELAHAIKANPASGQAVHVIHRSEAVFMRVYLSVWRSK